MALATGVAVVLVFIIMGVMAVTHKTYNGCNTRCRDV